MHPIQFSDDEDLPDICQDAVFKALMTKNTPPSRRARDSLLSAILDRPVTVISVNPNEPPVSGLRDRQIRFDLNVRLDNGELANVEMTKDPTPDEVLRMEYYAARLYTSQDLRGSRLDYRDLKKTWQISLLANRNLFPDEALIHRFVYYDREHDLDLRGRTGIISVELKKADKAGEGGTGTMSPPEKWAYFFRHLADKSKRRVINEILAAEEGIAMAGKAVQGFTKHEREALHQISKDKWQTDKQSWMAYGREEGREEGLRQGMEKGLLQGVEKGLLQGMEKGLRQGVEKGVTQGRREAVQMLAKYGMAPEQIAKALGLSPGVVLEYLRAE
jgi:predicted transposase/invertase (TIGR01784 family)